MTPYYDDGRCVIYHGDCREILPTLDPVDMVLTDPPYGLGDIWEGGGGPDAPTGGWRFPSDSTNHWDTRVDEVVELVDAAPTVIIWGGNYYPLPPTRCWFLWDKKQNDRWTTAQAEMAWTNVDRPVRTFRMSQVEAHSEMVPKEHPTQKPLSLMSWCIEVSRANPTSILDPFMGSGTTLRAAADRGISAIGIELDERYCEVAANRLAQGVLNFGT